MKRINPNHTSFARKLRTNNTEVEKILWYNLRNRQLGNIKFKRQYVIGRYIVDFVNLENKLIIEIDGGQHNEEINKKEDYYRTAWLNTKGYQVLRFWNNEILENLEGVLERINGTLHPHPSPLPKREREKEGMDERLYWLGFSAFPGIGPARFQKLLAFFGQAKSAWNADVADLKKSGIGEILAHKLVEFRENFSIPDYLQKLNDANVKFLTLRDPEYPNLLSRIKNPPFVLYIKGDFDFHHPENQKTIAFVGTRKITSYGTQVTELLVSDLAQAGCVIVSGLAIGVDSIAHRTTILSGGKTIAVLGSGVDCCYPAQNIALYRKILETGGAIVSEYPLGQEPTKGSFPSRNRIIAGLSIGVVVTEGAADSGALITAEDAFLNQRIVFAIPGPITSNYSKAPNALIARGAIPVTQSGDILQALAIPQHQSAKKIYTGTAEEQKIIELLQNAEMHIDELIKQMNIPASKVGTILSLMEMKGLIRNCGSGIFALADIS